MLSAACLPSVPPFFRECRLFLEKHTPFSHRTKYPTKPSSIPVGPDDNWAIDLARYDELQDPHKGNEYKAFSVL